MNFGEIIIIVLAWVPIFMMGFFVGSAIKKKKQHPAAELPPIQLEENPKGFVGDLPPFPTTLKLDPISIKPAGARAEGWHPADDDGDTLDEFPKTVRSMDLEEIRFGFVRGTEFADTIIEASGIKDHENEKCLTPSGVKKFKSSEYRRYASGEVKPVPEIKKRQISTPAQDWKPTSYSKIDRT